MGTLADWPRRVSNQEPTFGVQVPASLDCVTTHPPENRVSIIQETVQITPFAEDRGRDVSVLERNARVMRWIRGCEVVSS